MEWIFKFALLTYIFLSTLAGDVPNLPFLDLVSPNAFSGITYDSRAVTLPSPMQFGDMQYPIAYVKSSGIIIFVRLRSDILSVPKPFPISVQMIAPFWDDVDLSQNGQVSYLLNNKSDPTDVITKINSFLSTYIGSNFNADWILVVKWENVCHIRHNDCPVNESNSFQAVLATQTNASYAIYTYKCDELNWQYHNSVIGFSVSNSFFKNHPLSGTNQATDIACLNLPISNYSTVVYKIACGPTEVIHNNSCEISTCLQDKPCQHGGICNMGSSPDQYTCDCTGTGYQGVNCTEDINECDTNMENCHNKANCFNVEGTFRCQCKPGYIGNGTICTNTSECHNKATCSNAEGIITHSTVLISTNIPNDSVPLPNQTAPLPSITVYLIVVAVGGGLVIIILQVILILIIVFFYKNQQRCNQAEKPEYHCPQNPLYDNPSYGTTSGDVQLELQSSSLDNETIQNNHTSDEMYETVQVKEIEDVATDINPSYISNTSI